MCLVAHNGDLYDFPLLKAEMQKAGTPLNLTILCADSYVGFRDIYRKREEAKNAENVHYPLVLTCKQEKENKFRKLRLLLSPVMRHSSLERNSSSP